MLTYNQFKESLLDNLKGRVAPPDEVVLSTILKNNDICLDSLSVRREETSTNISPVVYLQPYYSEFQKGSSIFEIADNIFSIFSSNVVHPEFDLMCIDSFECAKNQITLSVVNKMLNEKRLSNFVHRPFLDLAIIYKYHFCTADGIEGSITITNQLLSKWGIAEDDLYQIACTNTSKQEWINLSVLDVMAELINDSAELHDLNLLNQNFDMYVFTNKEKKDGGCALLFSELFESFIQKLNSNNILGLYILPCSIHELIVIPKSNNELEAKYLKEIVTEVNSSVVSNQELLSSSIYYYDPITKQVSIIC